MKCYVLSFAVLIDIVILRNNIYGLFLNYLLPHKNISHRNKIKPDFRDLSIIISEV